MSDNKNIPIGYLDRMESASFLNLSANTFDRIAPTEFKHSRIRVGNRSAYYYSKDELQAYRDFREKRNQAGLEELTWKHLIAKNEELSLQNAELIEYGNIFRWVLGSQFPAGMDTEYSAIHMKSTMPEKYERAREVLIEFGLDIEELRTRMALGRDNHQEETNSNTEIYDSFLLKKEETQWENRGEPKECEEDNALDRQPPLSDLPEEQYRVFIKNFERKTSFVYARTSKKDNDIFVNSIKQTSCSKLLINLAASCQYLIFHGKRNTIFHGFQCNRKYDLWMVVAGLLYGDCDEQSQIRAKEEMFQYE